MTSTATAAERNPTPRIIALAVIILSPSSGRLTTLGINFLVPRSRKKPRTESMMGPESAPLTLKLTYQRENAKARVRLLDARCTAV
jgi:hypothetical protein